MQLKNTFTSGKMNKDTDVRLIPNTEFIHAENIRFFSKGKNGVGQVIKGNEIVSDLTNNQNYTCIKALSDIGSENIYYFLANGTDSKIVRYNLETKQSKVILQGSQLNFNPNKKILGANILYDNLYWVEQHNNAPRFVDTTKADEYALNGFAEEDISIIKEPPFEEPRIVLTYDANVSEEIKDKWVCFAYRYRYNDNSYSAVSFYSDWAFQNGPFFLDFLDKTNRGMKNTSNSAFIYFNSGGKNVVEIDLLFRESNTNNVYIIQSLNKKDERYEHDTEYSFKFVNNKAYAPIATDDVNSYYDNVPLLAKSQELIGNTLIYSNYYDGYNQLDANGSPIQVDVEYNLNSIRLDYSPVDFLTTTNDLEINFNASEFKKDAKIYFSLSLVDRQERESFPEFLKDYTITLRDDYTIASFVLSDEFLAFIQILKDDFNKHLRTSFDNDTPIPMPTTTDPTSFAVSVVGNFVTIKRFVGTIEITENVMGVPTTTIEPLLYDFSDIGNNVSFENSDIANSLHSNRSYELCLIHYDKYNRIIGVNTNKENTVYVPHKYSTYKNTISAKIKNNPPANAVKYKFGIKEPKKNYETVYVTKTYNEGIYKWLRLDYGNKDKILKGDVLIPKLFHGEARQVFNELDVLDIESKNYNFLGNNEEGGLYAKVSWADVGVEYVEKPLAAFYGGKSWYAHDGAKTYRTTITTPNLNIAIPAGSVVRIGINWDWDGDTVHYPSGGGEETIIAQTNYNSFFEMKDRQNIKFGAFEDSIGNYARNDLELSDRYFGGGSNGYLLPKHYAKYGDSYVFIARRQGGSGGGASNIAASISITDGTNYLVFETKPKPNPDVLFYEVPGTYKIENGRYLNENDEPIINGDKEIELKAYNCYAFGNGVESYTFKDGLREQNNYLNFNFRGWATLEDGYKRTHRATDLIYSDVYRKETKFNGLSKFYSHLPNFKTLFEEYGEIEDIKNRDTNLFVAQENKLGMVMYGKSVLYSQAGEETIQATNEVLSSYVGFQGIHGVGKSPESISEFNKVMYLADPKRGQILSVIGNEVKVISNDGIEDYTRDLFKNNSNLLGGFDPNNYEYLLFIGNDLNKVLSYQELVGAFNAFYTYAPDYILGVDKKLYTWKNGVMYEHETTDDYNNFYGIKHPSKIEFCSNQAVSEDKIFTCISIEDKEAWDIEVETRLAKTTVSKDEFVKKESFYFSNLNKNTNDDLSNAYGISNIIAITGNKVQVAQIPIQMSVGDKIGTETNRYDLVNIIGNELELNNVTGLNVGDFIFGLKNGLLDGGDIIGEYAVVKMSKTPTSKGSELFSVNTEVLKSN